MGKKEIMIESMTVRNRKSPYLRAYLSCPYAEKCHVRPHDDNFLPMTVVFTGRHVVLPGCDDPQPATITVDTETGKITSIQEGYLSKNDFSSNQDAIWIDAASNYILPGLVE